MRRNRQETMSEKMYRFRGLILVVSVPLLLITFVLFLMPHSFQNEEDVIINRKVNPVTAGSKSYAVIFDAGSSGSRVHVYCFDSNLNLVPIGNDLELFVQKKPGLSAYASDPYLAAESLQSLLEKAENVIPKELLRKTPVRVGATAGLRQLKGDASERILESVRDYLRENSTLKSSPDAVTVLDGTQEGAFQWVTINYLLGNLGKKYTKTVGVVDLGGGSVQMAYAISAEDAERAPKPSDGGAYVKKLFLKGTKYYLYVHSYLRYGLLAARADILKAGDDSDNPCILSGYQGSYKYGGADYDASASPSGSNVKQCQRVAYKALKVDEPKCTAMKCTFGGIWNGGGGDGQKKLFVASFFFDRAAEAGFVNPKLPTAQVRPMDFLDAAVRACSTKLTDAKSTYPRVEADNLLYLCMDLMYQYTLLTDGFGLAPRQLITLVKQVKYGNSLVEAAWPLGSAIEVASSSK